MARMTRLYAANKINRPLTIRFNQQASAMRNALTSQNDVPDR
jgi:hypothetical protein